MHHLSTSSAWIAALLLMALAPLAAMAGQSAATLYALNCMGCHFAPDDGSPDAPLGVGQFAQTDAGRVFFMRIPAGGGKPLSADQEQRLLREVLSWKKSCTVIIQDAPLLQYTGAR